MSLVIPFANPLGPQSGAARDGVIYGVLPRAAPVTSLEQTSVIAAPLVLRGDSASGTIAYSDVTATAGKVFANASDTASDEILVALPESGTVRAVLLEVTTAGTGSGTWAVGADYDDHTADVALPQTGTAPTLQALGTARVQLATPVLVTAVPQKRVSNQRRRWIRLRLSGATVSVAPVVNSVRFEMADPSHTDLTSIFAQGASPSFASRQSAHPSAGDLLLFGFDDVPLRMAPSVHRPAAEAGREWVYSKSDGSFTALPAARISDPSAQLTHTGGLNIGNAERAYIGNDVVLSYKTTGASTFVAPTGVTAVRVLVVGGGGAGGGGTSAVNYGGGGAGGTVRTNAALAVTPGVAVAVQVGAGGTKTANVGSAGGSSSFGALTATAGGGGDTTRTGGSNADFAGETGAAENHTAGGGAGAGEAGGADGASQGGDGVSSDITGAATFYGGGGGSVKVAAGAAGGDGGGGAGVAGAPGNVGANTGGGGGGGGISQPGGTGGSGIVIVRWTQAAVTHDVPIVPPSDFAKSTINGHSRYWLALRSTADTAAPILPENVTIRAAMARGVGAAGIPSPETTTYTRATVVARDLALANSTLILANVTTGAFASVEVPANQAIATATISLAVSVGDQLAVVQQLGHPTVNLGDGAIYLS